MRQKIQLIITIIATVLLFTSCFRTNSEEVITFSDTAIMSFSINKLKLTYDTISQTGKDTICTKDYTPKKNIFYIDQKRKLIYNPDSLPFGSNIKAVLLTVKTKNGGYLFTKSKETDKPVTFNGKDSIDLTKDTLFVVTSQDDKATTTYAIKVNVHKQKGNTFSWTKLDNYPYFSQLTDIRTITNEKSIFVFGLKKSKTIGYTNSIDGGRKWEEINQSFDENAYKSVITKNEYIYILSNKKLLRSHDGLTWETISSNNNDLKQLIAATPTEIFAISNEGIIKSSKDNGLTWEKELLGDEKDLLPISNITYVNKPLSVNDNISMLILSGKISNGQIVTWTKIIDNDSKSIKHKWLLISNDASNEHKLPNYDTYTLLNYNENIISIGIKDNKFIAIKESTNNAFSWEFNPLYTYPQIITPITPFGVTVDAKNYIWIISGNTVWKGRLNSLGWDNKNLFFTNMKK